MLRRDGVPLMLVVMLLVLPMLPPPHRAVACACAGGLRHGQGVGRALQALVP